MAVIRNPAGFIASGLVASGAGSAMDCVICKDYGYLYHVVTVASANLALQISHDGTGWMRHALYTATTTTGTALFSAYFPFVRMTMELRYGAATAYAYYQPGLL